MNDRDFKDQIAIAAIVEKSYQSLERACIKDGVLACLEMLEWQGNEEDAGAEYDILRQPTKRRGDPIYIAVVSKTNPAQGAMFCVNFEMTEQGMTAQLLPPRPLPANAQPKTN